MWRSGLPISPWWCIELLYWTRCRAPASMWHWSHCALFIASWHLQLISEIHYYVAYSIIMPFPFPGCFGCYCYKVCSNFVFIWIIHNSSLYSWNVSFGLHSCAWSSRCNCRLSPLHLQFNCKKILVMFLCVFMLFVIFKAIDNSVFRRSGKNLPGKLIRWNITRSDNLLFFYRWHTSMYTPQCTHRQEGGCIPTSPYFQYCLSL